MKYRRKELTEQVKALRKHDLSYREIGRILGVSDKWCRCLDQPEAMRKHRLAGIRWNSKRASPDAKPPKPLSNNYHTVKWRKWNKQHKMRESTKN